jgi:hypothetical protein
VGVMPDSGILPPLPHLVGLANAGIRKMRKGVNVRRS